MARPAVDRELLAALDDKLGASNTDRLLALVPPDVNQLVTKRDLAVFGAELHTDMADLRGELRTDMANLRAEFHTDMANLRGELRTDMANLRAELKTDMANLRAEFADLRSDFAHLRSEVKTDIASLDARMERRLRSQLITTIAAVSGVVSLATAIQMLAA